jgi:hypothetical protein
MKRLTRRSLLAASAALARAGFRRAAAEADAQAGGNGEPPRSARWISSWSGRRRRIAAAPAVRIARLKFVVLEATGESAAAASLTTRRSRPVDRGAHRIYAADINRWSLGRPLDPATPGQRLRIGRRPRGELGTSSRRWYQQPCLATAARGRADISADKAPPDLGERRKTIEFATGPFTCGRISTRSLSSTSPARSIATTIHYGGTRHAAGEAPATHVLLTGTPVNRIACGARGR